MIDEMNHYGKNNIPFLFIIDFDMLQPVILPLDRVDPRKISYDIDGKRNYGTAAAPGMETPVRLIRHPLPYEEYKEKFDLVVGHQMEGDSYLLNLTYPTKIEINISLAEIFLRSTARYKLLYDDEFVVFSPESFVKIRGTEISSYPMKGTIDAAVPDAVNAILNDEKEFAEHLTIVDLIRNDLNMVSTKVTVERFRYVEKIRTIEKDLYQVSSKITGVLPGGYNGRIGDILAAMLPAGSVTGAPKKKTVEIIKDAERYPRGYYTGIFGYFDGSSLDSAVMIRFIERCVDGTYYKSGGGITVYSNPRLEYQELIDKVYVPIV